jgi:tRNA(Ile)-lysidine synthase TilS/MesJ
MYKMCKKMFNRCFLFTLTIFAFSTLQAQKAISLEEIWKKNTFSARSVPGFSFQNDGRHYTRLDANKIVQYDLTTGSSTASLFDPATLNPNLGIDAYQFSADESKLILATAVEPIYRHSSRASFYVYDRNLKQLSPLFAEGKTMCSLCSRLRRGILYRVAGELGCNKIALGHHRDDILQTFFLNMFYGGKLKAMPPKLVSDGGDHMVIRPLAYVAEKDLERWAKVRQFPIIPCTLCGSQDGLQRQVVGEMLREWEKKHPGRIENMFAAMQNVVPSHLMDHTKFDFKNLKSTGVSSEDGDKAFDHEEFPMATLPGMQVVSL